MRNPRLDAFFEKMDALGLRLTYDDVRLETDESDISSAQTNLTSHFSRNVPLLAPVASSAMDTVTEARMAIAMARAGGIGVIHKNMDPRTQAKQVRRVKLHLNGLIERPITVSGDMTLAAINAMREEKRFKFHSFPVHENGKMIGMLTGSDFRFAAGDQITAKEAMTPLDDDFLYGSTTTTEEEARTAMRQRKRNVMPLLNECGEVVGMYVFSDLERIALGTSGYNVDAKGQLYAAAAVGAGPEAIERAEELNDAGCDVFVIDTAHAYSQNVADTIRELKRKFSIDVVVGNISRDAAVGWLISAGADGILVGQGPGSICTTRVVAGIGCPQVSAVYRCAKAARGTDVPVCADGGIQNSGDITVALAVGANSVMLGSLLAGTDMSPGDIIQEGTRPMKVYRGMGSMSAMRARAESRARYRQGDNPIDKLVPEGIEAKVPYAGPLADVLDQYLGGVRSGFGYVGCSTIAELQERAEIFRITGAGLRESHPHDVIV